MQTDYSRAILKYLIRNGLPWFETEQPDEAIKEYVESGVWIMFEEYEEIV